MNQEEAAKAQAGIDIEVQTGLLSIEGGNQAEIRAKVAAGSDSVAPVLLVHHTGPSERIAKAAASELWESPTRTAPGKAAPDPWPSLFQTAFGLPTRIWPGATMWLESDGDGYSCVVESGAQAAFDSGRGMLLMGLGRRAARAWKRKGVKTGAENQLRFRLDPESAELLLSAQRASRLCFLIPVCGKRQFGALTLTDVRQR